MLDGVVRDVDESGNDVGMKLDSYLAPNVPKSKGDWIERAGQEDRSRLSGWRRRPENQQQKVRTGVKSTYQDWIDRDQ